MNDREIAALFDLVDHLLESDSLAGAGVAQHNYRLGFVRLGDSNADRF